MDLAMASRAAELVRVQEAIASLFAELPAGYPWPGYRRPRGVPAAPAGLPRLGLGARVLGTGAQAPGSEGAEGVHVDHDVAMGRGSGILRRPREAAATPRSPRR
jgi:hypothetical protein